MLTVKSAMPASTCSSVYMCVPFWLHFMYYVQAWWHDHIHTTHSLYVVHTHTHTCSTHTKKYISPMYTVGIRDPKCVFCASFVHICVTFWCVPVSLCVLVYLWWWFQWLLCSHCRRIMILFGWTLLVQHVLCIVLRITTLYSNPVEIILM